MATLEDLAERLGPKMLEISDVAVYDPSELGHGPPGALYLGVGLGQGSNLTDAVEALGNVNASALALKPEILAGLDVESLPNPGGVALLSLTEAANWAQMVVLFRSAIGPDQFLGPEELAGIAAGDLFAVANAVAALIDAPVTIEDAEQRVLAYSAGQERADAPRSASILGRRVPDKWINSAACFWIAATTSGWQWPVAQTAMPAAKSRNVLPSTSSIMAP